MSDTIRTYQEGDLKKLLEFYEQIDHQYVPKLSERDGGLQSHIDNILDKNGGFFLYLVNNNIEGACGYFPLNKEKTSVEFTLFSFFEIHGNTLKPYYLGRDMLQKKDELGYSNIDRFFARTFYEKSANRLAKLGFNLVEKIENDVVEGRTSYYFEANAEDVFKKFRLSK